MGVWLCLLGTLGNPDQGHLDTPHPGSGGAHNYFVQRGLFVVVKTPRKGFESLCLYQGLIEGLIEGCLGGMGS